MRETTLPRSPRQPLRCLLVSPEFPGISFWNWKRICETRGEKAMGLPLGLLTLAAILPQNWKFRLVDQNTRKLTDRDIRWADLVCVSGMYVQQLGVFDVIRRAQRLGKFVVVGGPDPTTQPAVYQEADALVLGEAETNVPIWLDAWEQGSPQGTFRPGEAPDVTKSPIPRFDLVHLNDYFAVNVQYSRGCPHNCEFCTVIELYGRKPRTKTPEQICREMETLFQLGYHGWVDFVDDNFIGNKRNVKQMLPVLADWCKRRKYPFFFSTEASLNLGDDPGLMDLMVSAEFRYIFTGIETAEEELLQRAQKSVNTQRPLRERIESLYAHGLAVFAGFILGFDGESEKTADAILACVEENALPVAMVSLLVAVPTSQLSRRLVQEGRLTDAQGNTIGPDQPFTLQMDPSIGVIRDQALDGLNFKTERNRADILKDQIRIINALYDPEKFMSRAAEAVLRLRPASKHKPNFPEWWTDIKGFCRLIVWMHRRPETRKHFWRLLRRTFKLGKARFEMAGAMATIYLHLAESLLPERCRTSGRSC
jgi:radical SAM superfamily enzyme YgiQ (UPF0313 family)